MYAGRFDARQDLPTLLDALAILGREAAPVRRGPRDWPPRGCLVGATPDDRASLSRAAVPRGRVRRARLRAGLPDDRLAGLVAGARVALQPARSEATGLAAMEAIAAGVPVVATAVGTLPEIVGAAGILVEPGDAARLATAIRAAWTEDGPYPALVAAARERVRHDAHLGGRRARDPRGLVGRGAARAAAVTPGAGAGPGRRLRVEATARRRDRGRRRALLERRPLVPSGPPG